MQIQVQVDATSTADGFHYTRRRYNDVDQALPKGQTPFSESFAAFVCWYMGCSGRSRPSRKSSRGGVNHVARAQPRKRGSDQARTGRISGDAGFAADAGAGAPALGTRRSVL